jgi:hypothetical protein
VVGGRRSFSIWMSGLVPFHSIQTARSNWDMPAGPGSAAIRGRGSVVGSEG